MINIPPKILIVDDERFHLNVMTNLLGNDYKVLVAKEGERALDIAVSETPPDLILLDVLMPGTDGYEVCKRLKENDKTRHIPVIFLTVKRDVEDEAYGFSLGAVDYITKPISPPIVKARVATQLALSRALLELENHNEKLEHKVKERTAEIISAQQERERLQLQLQQSQKMETIGRLAGGIAHDFGNILSAVVGFVELARFSYESDNCDGLADYLERISLGGEQAKGLVEQLSAFSRGVPGQARPLDLARLVDEVLKLLQPVLPSSITLLVQLDKDVPIVMIDKVQMHQVLMNLFLNARDAMNNKGVLKVSLRYRKNHSIECSSCHEMLEGDFVELAVEDSGSGIDASLIGEIFDVFFSTKDIGKGTGMGLSVVNDITHRYQGHIVVESEVDNGTKFSLLFPPAHEGAGEKHKSQALVRSVHHILLAGCDDSVGFLLKELLETNAYRVTVYHDSAHALETFSAQPNKFNLIIYDDENSELDGSYFVQYVRNVSRDLPVIFCAESGSLSAEGAGVRGLIKPVQNEQLLQFIQELLGASGKNECP